MRVLRAGLVSLLSRPSDLRVVAQLGNSEELVPVTIMIRPDIALIDLDMPGGTSALASLREAFPECRTLILYDPGDPDHITRSTAAPADALIQKNASPDLLVSTVRHLAAGDARGRRVTAHQATARVASNPLTPREVAVLRVASEGVSAAEIAGRLHLSPGTVRNYISRAISKTGSRNRFEAVRIAQRQGWLLSSPRRR